MDGMVDATDASAVLDEYATVSCNQDSILSPLQSKLADFNGDSIVDSADASDIISHYAEMSVESDV